MTNKVVAIVLLLTLGFFGMHRFYLGQPLIGFSYFIGTIFSVVLIVLGVGLLGFPIIAGLLAVDLWDLIKTSHHHFRSNIAHEIDEFES